jgi:hypothetical protein
MASLVLSRISESVYRLESVYTNPPISTPY